MTARMAIWAPAVVMMIAGIGGSRAGGIVDCRTPYAYNAAINVFVLEDASDAESDASLRDIRLRLPWLVKLDALFSDSYGSLGVLFLKQNADNPCTLASVVKDYRRELPNHGAAVFIDQRVYRENDKIFVQTYLDFFRLDDRKEPKREVIRVTVPQREVTLSEELPAQQLSFPPHELAAADVEAIEQDFAGASILYEAPDAASGGRQIDLSPKDGTIAFQVKETRPDGWIRIDSTESGGAIAGWLRADPKVTEHLRALLPELSFVDGLVGYLTFVQDRDHAFDGLEMQKDTPVRADGRLYDYAYSTPPRVNRHVSGAKREGAGPEAVTLAAALRIDMALTNINQLDLALDALFRSAGASRDSKLRDLLGVTSVAGCCTRILESPTARAFRLSDLSWAIPNFQAALEIDPTNQQALANLAGAYRLIQADVKDGLPETTDVRQELRHYYENRLPSILKLTEGLDGRLTEVQSLLSAQQK